PVAESAVAGAAVSAGRTSGQGQARRVEVELRPACPGEPPLLLVPLHEALTRVAHLQHDGGLLLPAGVLALEEVSEEALLQADAVVGVEVRPVLDAVHLEPFLARCRAHESLEVAARVQS